MPSHAVSQAGREEGRTYRSVGPLPGTQPFGPCCGSVSVDQNNGIRGESGGGQSLVGRTHIFLGFFFVFFWIFFFTFRH